MTLMPCRYHQSLMTIWTILGMWFPQEDYPENRDTERGLL